MKRLFGGLFVLAAVPVAFIWMGYVRFAGHVRREIGALMRESKHAPGPIVTEEMLEPLPAPVQRYLRYTGVVGKPIPSTVYLTQTGRIRRAKDEPWMDVRAEEYYSVNPPGFVWNASVGNRGLPIVRGSDHLIGGKGHMLIKMLGTFLLVDARGEEMDQGTLMRFLNELMWFPTAFLASNVSWRAIDTCSAEVTLTDNGRSVSAILYFDRGGRLIDFVADRYYQIAGGRSYEYRRWSTPITEYGELGGLKLPVKGKAVWKLDDGDFEYAELEVKRIEYHN